MGFLAKFGNRRTKKTKNVKKEVLTVVETLLRDIETQRKLLKGEDLKNAKGKPLRSWFKENKADDFDGDFIPFVGITSLFGDDKFRYKNNERAEILDELQSDITAGGLKDEIAEVEKKLKKAADEAKKSRELKKKEKEKADKK